jgi:hypothetical protein
LVQRRCADRVEDHVEAVEEIVDEIFMPLTQA